jgi:Acetyltransferase (GNAT) domain
MEVRALTAADEDAYAAFLAGRPEALVFHSLPYRDLLCEHLGCRAEYLVAVEGGELRGALPVMWAGAVANSLPYYGSHGSVLGDDAAAREALLDAWDERANDPGTAAATLVENPFASPLPREPAHDLLDERLNQATALDRPVLELAEPSAARNVRHAAKEGVVVAVAEDGLGELAELHAEHMATIGGRAKDHSFFAAVPRHFARGREFDVYLARRDGEVAAALLVFWAGATAEYFCPANAGEHLASQPLAAILARALDDARERGLAWWNWGGSWASQDGVRRFKRKWGGRPAPYRYFCRVGDRALLDASPAELQAAYGHFFVVPYGALRSGVA